jgi:hypothetical protein
MTTRRHERAIWSVAGAALATGGLLAAAWARDAGAPSATMRVGEPPASPGTSGPTPARNDKPAGATTPDKPRGLAARPGQPAQLDDGERAKVEEQLRTIAKEYKAYRRVSAELHWSPAMCRMPEAPAVKLSAAPDGSPHGRKLYFLYARDGDAYDTMSRHGLDDKNQPVADAPACSNPVGQAVVKEAFTPVPAASELDHYKELKQLFYADPKGPSTKELERYAHDDHDELVRAGDLAALFVMLKLEPATKGTDRGWVYATINPDLSTITSMGVIESCMNCHEQTDRDRLYGDRRTWPAHWPGTRPAPGSAPTTAK